MAKRKPGITTLYRAEFNAWIDMRKRCTQEKNPRWKDYGGRGITFCDRWKLFKNFLADIGPRPSSEYSLDRVDNDGNYTPENCRWATRIQQQQNRREREKHKDSKHMLTYNGKTQNICEWAKELGISIKTIRGRIDRREEWTDEEILATPMYGRYKNAMMATINGKTQSVRKWIIELGFRDNTTVYGRLNRGWTVEKALLTPARTYKRKF